MCRRRSCCASAMLLRRLCNTASGRLRTCFAHHHIMSHGIFNHRQLDCFKQFNNKETAKVHIIHPQCNPPVFGWQTTSNAEIISKSWRHHVTYRLQYNQCIMQTVCDLLCFVLLRYRQILPLSLRVTALTLGQYTITPVSKKVDGQMGSG